MGKKSAVGLPGPGRAVAGCTQQVEEPHLGSGARPCRGQLPATANERALGLPGQAVPRPGSPNRQNALAWTPRPDSCHGQVPATTKRTHLGPRARPCRGQVPVYNRQGERTWAPGSDSCHDLSRKSGQLRAAPRAARVPRRPSGVGGDKLQLLRPTTVGGSRPDSPGILAKFKQSRRASELRPRREAGSRAWPPTGALSP
jgi:hypothetical protein